jgi:predicted small metal-binding protein
MPKSFGGQMRTIECCECGWTCRKQLQEANKLYKLHMRLTHKSTAIIETEFTTGQGFGGATSSKHGNPKFIPLTATGITVSK